MRPLNRLTMPLVWGVAAIPDAVPLASFVNGLGARRYIPLIEKKINAQDQAPPLALWDLPPAFSTLR